MLLSPEELESNINRMRLKLSTEHEDCAHRISDYHKSTARLASATIPLTHTTPETSFLKIVDTGALLSAKQRGARSRRADIALNGTDEICFYLGSAAFPENEFGFLFSSDLTELSRDNASGTPFDSGGCIRRYPLPNGTNGFEHVKAHSMPVPACRDYLGDLLASHYEDIHAYLAGKEFTCPCCRKELRDPHGMTAIDEHALVRTHEVRIPKRVELAYPMLVAILAPKGNVPLALAPLVKSGVELLNYDDSSSQDRTTALRRESIRYILRNLTH